MTDEELINGDGDDHARNLGMELVRATEAAALAAARWAGRGQKEAGDQAAVDAFRTLLNMIPMRGKIVIGEGEKDKAPMLYNGEKVGTGRGRKYDIALDPVEGTNLLAKGLPGSIAVIAAAPKKTFFDPGPAFYMDKLIVGPAGVGKVDLDAPVRDNLEALAKAKSMRVSELTVIVLDRERNKDKIRAIREAGARIRLITDGDVAPSVMVALPDTGVDMVLGIGGTPEGVISAAAMRGLGGEMQGRLAPQSAEEMKRVLEAGMDLTRTLTYEELASGDDIFFAATGITQGGEFLHGVRYTAEGAVTSSLVTRSLTGTWRVVEAYHRWDKLTQISAIPY